MYCWHTYSTVLYVFNFFYFWPKFFKESTSELNNSFRTFSGIIYGTMYHKPISFKCSRNSVNSWPILFEPLTLTVKFPLTSTWVNGESRMHTTRMNGEWWLQMTEPREHCSNSLLSLCTTKTHYHNVTLRINNAHQHHGLFRPEDTLQINTQLGFTTQWFACKHSICNGHKFRKNGRLNKNQELFLCAHTEKDVTHKLPF